ncbi:DNA transposition protein [Plastoroseomonas hellenica]|uniref:DNA transposition protein n=1 Tax=Plastoroseomonas hellenica TaxID=2687306 RepID=UPI001BA885E7|nr:DNA transposition protein [Plastoroseomonas hellenica]MBR0644018.1 DNA transposition protein [Plastoroseomonas hellenica]
MARARTSQPDLLEWKPPQTVVAFDETVIRAATIAGRVGKAVGQAMKDCGMPRQEVAKRMSAFLGAQVSAAMLDAYASEARTDHQISVVRLVALLHVTRDRRLLELLAEMFGWAVIERRHLPLIEVAALRDKEDELKRQREALMRQARQGGSL